MNFWNALHLLHYERKNNKRSATGHPELYLNV